MGKKKTPEATPAPAAKLTLQLGSETYQGEGPTVLAALRNMKVPDKIMLRGLVTVEQNETKKTLTYTPLRLRRLLFPSPTFQAIQVKNLVNGLK